MSKKVILQLFLFFVILFTSYVGYLKYPSVFESFENRLNDIMFLVRGKAKADSRIVIIDIDEKSLQELGQWPWSRNTVAKILQNLSEYGIGIVGLDVVFAEADNSSPKKVLDKLGMDSSGVEDYDAILSQTISETPTIIGYVFALQNDALESENYPKSSGVIIEQNKPDSSYLIKAYRPILNIPNIQEAAYSNGYFNTIPDRDGIVRSIPLVMEYDGLLYPALSLEMIRIIMQESQVKVNYYDKGVETISIGDLIIPTDIFGRLMVNYRGAQHQFEYISASDVFFKRIQEGKLDGKIALLGTSAAGLLDLRSTPYDSVYPGVEVHANALDNLLNKDFLAKPNWVFGADLALISIFLFLTFCIILISNALFSFILFLIINVILIFLNYTFMMSEGIILNTFFPLTGIFILFLIGESINYFFETKQKNKIKSKFAAKVSSAVVDELIKQKDDGSLDGKEEEITIFFSDIRGFTSLSEKMNSAKELISFLNRYMTPMVEIIVKYKGTVDKFIGDAIMAYWNAPVPTKNHADKALQASIEQIRALSKLNEALVLEEKPTINIGIGLNSGLSIVGEMGSKGRSDYTCIGDPVNLASRAEGLCKPYGANIILTEFTKNLLKEDTYALIELDVVRVKGKAQPIKIYECYGDSRGVWKEYSQLNIQFEEAIIEYRKANFFEAHKRFVNLFEQYNVKLYEIYIQRCEYFMENPPAQFDGVFTFETK